MTGTPSGTPRGDPSDGGSNAPASVVATLRNERRRDVVAALLDAGSELSLVTLADQLSDAAETPLPVMVVELHDVHLPALASCDAVAFDDESGFVTLLLPPETTAAALREVETSGDVEE
jgi:hypothetical protein